MPILHAHVPTDWAERSPHGELVNVRDGKVTEMVVYPTVEDVLSQARPETIVSGTTYSRLMSTESWSEPPAPSPASTSAIQ